MDTTNVVLFTNASNPAGGASALIESIAHVFSAIAWPLAVCIGIYMLRSKLEYLISRVADRLTSATFSGVGKFELREEERERKQVGVADAGVPLQTPALYVGKLKKDKVGSLYWLGSDMMAASHVVASGQPRQRIVAILRQCDHHLKVIGFENTPIHERLLRLYRDADKSNNADWTDVKRVQYLTDLGEIRMAVGKIIETFEPGFQGSPDDGRRAEFGV
jgi:hypothetical protein